MTTSQTTRPITVKGTTFPAGTIVRAKVSAGTGKGTYLVVTPAGSKYFQVSPVAGL